MLQAMSLAVLWFLKRTRIRVGVWGTDVDDEITFNWNEFQNLVETLEVEGRNGNLHEALIFF